MSTFACENAKGAVKGMDKAKLAVTLQELGILPEEYDKIVEYLDGREPNYTELSIYSVMWSEHASYKNSIRWIKTLPREGRLGVRIQDRVAQPSVRRGAVPGCGDRGRGNKP